MSIEANIKQAQLYMKDLPVAKREQLGLTIEQHFRLKYKPKIRCDYDEGSKSDIVNHFNGSMNCGCLIKPELIFYAYISTAEKYDLPRIEEVKVTSSPR